MIPKKIHYIWFGQSKSKIAEQAIRTWKERAPEYQICEWNESNLPKFSNPFFNEAMANKDYAFASDYARLWVLENYGGVYLDTDMYLLRDINDILSNRDLVFGIIDKNYIFSTSFIACEKHQPFIERALLVYDNLMYSPKNKIANSAMLSPLMLDYYNFESEDKTQEADNGKVAAFNSNVLLQPSFRSVAVHIGEKAWGKHDRHDEIRIRLRQHIKNRFTAGTFRIVNDLGRKIMN